jgi:hypothetical protein
MLKLFLGCLLAANALLFAYHQGHLEALVSSGREPARVANQINPNKVKLLPPAAAQAAPGSPGEPGSQIGSPGVSAPMAATALPASMVSNGAGTAAQLAAAKKGIVLACTEIGNFNTADAKRFEAQLTALALGDKLVRREIKETSSHMVWIPPQGGKDGADKKAGELRNLGVNDFYIILENNPQHWGISLGIFKTEEAARAHLNALNQKGVRSARLIEHKIPLNKAAFQLRQLDAGGKEILDRIRAGFPAQEARECGAVEAA